MRVPPFVSRTERSNTDYTTQEGAHILAGMIRAAWKRAGHDIPVDVVPVFHPHPPHGPWKVVMPTLIRGLPV